MLSPGKGGSAPVYGHALGHGTYERHRPEQTLLYQLVEKHYPALVEQLECQGKSLPAHVHREFEAYLKCGRLEHGFLRVRCDTCHFERLVAFSCKKRGFCPSCGARRMAETAAQGRRDWCSDSDPALRLGSQPQSERGPIHFHILFLDGVYIYRDNRRPRFQRVKAPDKSELEDLVQSISQRAGRCLERLGLLEQDAEQAWLELDRCRARPRRRD